MRRLPHFAALLLVSPVFVAAATAAAQRCEDQLAHIAARQAAATVSAADLRIPRQAWAHLEKARAASDANRDDVFEREAALALAAAPAFTRVYLLRAERQVHARQYAAAVDTITAARQIQPEVPWSSIVLASALSELHRYNEAVNELDRARGVEAESWQWTFERTRAEIGRRNVEGALHWSERAVATAPSACVNAHLLRADAFQLAGQWPDAIHQMETYLGSGGQLTYRSQVLQALERTRERLREDNTDLLATNESAH